MKKKLVTLMIMLCAAAVPLTGCAIPGIGNVTVEKDADKDDDDDDDKDEDASATKIKLSDDEIVLTEGESVEVTVKNADDLKKLSVESDDEDILEAELDEDTITLTAGDVKKNKETTVVVSAKGCDDREISVTIIDLDGDSGSSSSGSGDDGGDWDSSLPDEVIPNDSDDSKPSSSSTDTGAYSEVAGTYSGYIYFSEDAEIDFYEENLGVSYSLATDMAKCGSFGVETTVVLSSTGTVTLTLDTDSMIETMCYAIDVNFVDFYRELQGDYTTSDSAILAYKDDAIEEFRTILVTEYGYGEAMTWTDDTTYTYSDGYIRLASGTYWEYDSSSPQCIVINTADLIAAGTDTVYLFKK